MMDFLRSLTRSAEEKRRERLNAYVDGALSERDRRRFEEELAGDPRLQAELKEIETVRAALRRLPRMRPPRNFTLDPAVYGMPKPNHAAQWYPVLRTATALAAIAFAFLLALNLFVSPLMAPKASDEFAAEQPVEAEFGVPEAVEEEAVAEGDFAESAALSAEQTAPPLEMEAAGEAAASSAAADEAVTDEAAAGEAAAVEEAPAPEATQPAREEAPAAPEAEGAVDVTTEDALESPAYPEPPTPQSVLPLEYPEPPTQPTEEVALQPAPTPSPELPAETAAATVTPESESAPFPILLLAQIATGALFFGLLVTLLVVRRRL